MKPESYPFLRIAKQFGVPYEDVLRHAARYRFNVGNYVFESYSELDFQVVSACFVFLNIQEGLMCWETGEYIGNEDV